MLVRSGLFVGVVLLASSGAMAQVAAEGEQAPVPMQAPMTLPSLEIKAEAAILGPEVHLRQIARWMRADTAFFAGSADLVVARFEPEQQTLLLDLAALRTTLEGAGLTGSEISIRGATRVSVTRLDWKSPDARKAPIPEPKEFEQLLGPKGGKPAVRQTPPDVNGILGGADEGAKTGEKPAGASESTVEPLAEPVLATDKEGAVAAKPTGVSLREALHQDLSDRLGIKREDIEIAFDPADERVLRAMEPTFTWSIVGTRTGNLGAVRWAVTLWAGKNSVAAKKLDIQARARAWETDMVLRKGLAIGQQVREEDIEEKRLLVDKLPEDMRVTREQALMMQANRKLSPGTVLTGRCLDPMMLVRTGQTVTLTLTEGAFEVRAVARAMEGGAYGSTIRVKSEATGDTLQVTVTGPQEARLGPAVAKEVK